MQTADGIKRMDKMLGRGVLRKKEEIMAKQLYQSEKSTG